MFIPDDYQVVEKEKAYVVSIIGGEEKVKIKKKIITKYFPTIDDPKMVAILLGSIELIRVNTKALKCKLPQIIKKEEVLWKINTLLREKNIESLILEINSMKYYEIVKFLEA